MTEDQKSTAKVKVINFAKLAVAIGALSAAINGYIQVRKDQNNLLEVMSDKVDAIVLKVAYLEGRMEGLNPRAAADEAKRLVLPPPPVVRPDPLPASDGDGIPESAPPADQRGRTIRVRAGADRQLYQQMPRTFDALQAVVNQKVDKLNEERIEAAAPPEDEAP